MRKQELFILGITLTAWLMTLGGRAFFGLLFFQLYTALYLPKIFTQFQWMRIPFVTSILLLLSLVMNNTKKIFYSKQFKLMVAFYIVMIISRAINGVEVFAHEYMELYLKLIFAHILITNLINDQNKLKHFLWIIVVTCGVLAYVAHYKGSTKAFGWMDKNDFAAILVAGSAYPIMFALHQKKILYKVEPILYFIVIVYSVIGSNSRGGLLALGVVLFLLLMANFSFKRLLLLVAVASVILFRTAGTYIENVQSIQVEATEQSGTGGQRIGAWLTAIEVIKDKPLLGIGPGEFTNNYLRYATAEARRKVGERHTSINTHSTLFQVAAETGFIGLAIFLFIIFVTYADIINAFKLARHDPALSELLPMITAIGVTITGHLTAGLFLNYGYNLQLYTLVVLATVANKVTVDMKAKSLSENNNEQEVSDNISYALQFVLRSSLFVVSAYICLRL